MCRGQSSCLFGALHIQTVTNTDQTHGSHLYRCGMPGFSKHETVWGKGIVNEIQCKSCNEDLGCCECSFYTAVYLRASYVPVRVLQGFRCILSPSHNSEVVFITHFTDWEAMGWLPAQGHTTNTWRKEQGFVLADHWAEEEWWGPGSTVLPDSPFIFSVMTRYKECFLDQKHYVSRMEMEWQAEEYSQAWGEQWQSSKVSHDGKFHSEGRTWN